MTTSSPLRFRCRRWLEGSIRTILKLILDKNIIRRTSNLSLNTCNINRRNSQKGMIYGVIQNDVRYFKTLRNSFSNAPLPDWISIEGKLKYFHFLSSWMFYREFLESRGRRPEEESIRSQDRFGTSGVATWSASRMRLFRWSESSANTTAATP